MGDEVRHGLPEDRVNKKHAGDDHQRQADAAPHRLEQQDDADAAENGFDGKPEVDTEEREVVDEKRAGPHGQSGVAEIHVQRAAGSEERDGDVVEGQRPRRQALGRREHQKTQHQSEGEVDAARRDADDDCEVEEERKRRSDPQLEQRPGERDQADDDGKPWPQVTARILDLLEELLGIGGRLGREAACVGRGHAAT